MDNITTADSGGPGLTPEMFMQLFEATPDARVLVDVHARIILVNQKAEILLGYAQAEMLGQKVHMLVPEDKRKLHEHLHSDYMQNPVARSMAALQAMRLELTARRKDGSTFPTEISLNPIRAEGQIFVLCIIRDVTTRKEYEQALQAQTDMVRLLQDVAIAANEANSISAAFQFTLERLVKFLGWPLGHAFLVTENEALTSTQIWAGGAVDRFTAFKQASESITFHADDSLPGMALSSGQPVWLNGLEGQPQFLRGLQARTAGLQTGLAVPVLVGRAVVGVLEFFNTDQVPPNANLMAVLPHIGMQLGRVVERKNSEDALRTAATQMQMVLANMPVFLSVIDRSGRLIMLEGKAFATTGLDANALLGQNIFEQLPTRTGLAAAIRRALAGEVIRTELTSQTGAIFENIFAPYSSVPGTVEGVIGLSFDISQRKQMENELEEVKHRLLDSIDNERAHMARQLHDGPLQDLYGVFYQIQEIRGLLGPQEQDLAGKALSTIQQVNATLRAIVGELHPNTLVHLGLQKAIRSHAERLQERQPEITLHLDLSDDGQSLAYPLRLGLFRVYQQLVINAMVHAKGQHVWVLLRLLPDQVILQVQDNGRGFQVPEHWVELVRAGKFGLATAVERIERLNGKLEIESQPEGGTTVRVEVPRL